MREKDNGDKLLDELLDMVGGSAAGLMYTDAAAVAYQLAGAVVHEIDTVKEENAALKEQIRELKCKLQQYAKLESMWDEQEVGVLCDVTIGDWIRPNIAPAVKKMKGRIADLEQKTALTIGVGGGDGQLFVHGDYDSIKAVQSKIFELEASRSRIAELEAQAAIGKRAVEMSERLQKLLGEVEAKLYEAHDRRVPECCGRGHGECCGDFVESWADADNATMDALGPVRNELAAILREYSGVIDK